MRLVVDASVAVKWVVAEENSDIARRLLSEGYELFAPRLMAAAADDKFANALGLTRYAAAVVGLADLSAPTQGGRGKA